MSNPFLTLSAAEIDVLDDMLAEWRDRDRHAELDYGPKKTDAFNKLSSRVTEAWRIRVNFADPEKDETA
ncbi:hypothetical protein AB0I16_33330 [Streptomyces sp. NPDC050703]|uniref:hypothetical protein n=1 Tax=Streptomyces sp. NPDC050703 TaxID=3157218 RepID=UPI00342F93EC